MHHTQSLAAHILTLAGIAPRAENLLHDSAGRVPAHTGGLVTMLTRERLASIGALAILAAAMSATSRDAAAQSREELARIDAALPARAPARPLKPLVQRDRRR
jgi:hypothetical protein